MDVLFGLFDTSGFPARWYCGSWSDALGWIHILSDIGIFAAYTAIPCILAYFILNKEDAPFPRILWLFCAFILACGMTHLVEAIIFWHPIYRFAGVGKLATAIISWATVLSLFPIVPQALSLRSPEELQAEIDARTAELQAERDDNALLAALVESSPDAILSKGMDGRIQTWNHAAEELFGYSADEAIGQHVGMLVPKEHHEALEGLLARVYGGERFHQIESVKQDRDGRQFPVSLSISPVRSLTGEIVAASAVVRDISHMKEAEHKLKLLNEQLQEKNEEMEQFVYTVSHDLKSPLVTLTGFLALLREDIEEGDDDSTADDLDRLERSAERMNALIRDLLEFSRVGYLREEVRAVDLDPLVRQLASDLEGAQQTRGGHIEVEGALPSVQGSERRLHEVFENLLLNAVKYGAAEGDAPRITVGRVEVEGERRVFVRDDGPGIDPAYHERIFGLFQRVSDKNEGTGVGLAIVARIMKAHGGRAWVESSPGAGATFWLAFPHAWPFAESRHIDA